MIEMSLINSNSLAIDEWYMLATLTRLWSDAYTTDSITT